jgi:undecaprenyl diphosphate synthase
MNELRHVAIIMDGNGRWAESRALPRAEGHRQGSLQVETVLDAAEKLGIKYVTLYAFSTENWKRSPAEVLALMKLL